MACGWAKAAVAASYAGLVASGVVVLGSAGSLTLIGAAGAVLSLGGLIGSLVELHDCLVIADRLAEAQQLQQQIDELRRERDRLQQLIQGH
jgi:hypothetical protein